MAKQVSNILLAAIACLGDSEAALGQGALSQGQRGEARRRKRTWEFLLWLARAKGGAGRSGGKAAAAAARPSQQWLGQAAWGWVQGFLFL